MVTESLRLVTAMRAGARAPPAHCLAAPALHGVGRRPNAHPLGAGPVLLPMRSACHPPSPASLVGRGQRQADHVFPQVCGSPDIPLHLLKSVATYKGIEASAPLAQWFWEVMESLSNTERSLFLRFVWGRTRLPRTIADFRGRDFVIQVRLPLGLWCHVLVCFLTGLMR